MMSSDGTGAANGPDGADPSVIPPACVVDRVASVIAEQLQERPPRAALQYLVWDALGTAVTLTKRLQAVIAERLLRHATFRIDALKVLQAWPEDVQLANLAQAIARQNIFADCHDADACQVYADCLTPLGVPTELVPVPLGRIQSPATEPYQLIAKVDAVLLFPAAAPDDTFPETLQRAANGTATGGRLFIGGHGQAVPMALMMDSVLPMLRESSFTVAVDETLPADARLWIATRH